MTRIVHALRSERGYTLPELLISCAVFGTLVAAVLGIYEMTLSQVTAASALEDAQSTLRAGLDRMAVDLRLAGSYFAGANGATDAVTAATATSVTFLGDVDADSVSGTTESTISVTASGTTATVSGVPSAFNTYATATSNDWMYVANGSTREVRRVAGVSGSVVTLASALTNSYPAGSIVRAVEQVTYTYDATARTLSRQLGAGTADVLADNVRGMTLTYYDSTGTSLGSTPATLSAIFEIEVVLTTEGGSGTRRTMATRVRLRNRNS
jgi:prepilin-type N-terminal cleavage/methylation domain-containing protein